MTVALVVVDVQNDFTHPKGSMYIGSNLVSSISQITADYDHVVYTRDYHPPVTNHFDAYGGQWPTHCVGGTWGADYNRDLVRRLGAPEVLKGVHRHEDGYSGFLIEREGWSYPTDLDDILQERDVSEVHIVGAALDGCVETTALDAKELGYKTVVVVEATASVTPAGATAALEELHDAGVYLL